jgi:hypothetical protein
MGTDEMREIAGIIKRVLANTAPTTIATGKQAGERSRARYELAAAVAEEARGRVHALLGRHLLYPELDPEILAGWSPPGA